MKNFRILYKQALIALLSVSIVACDDDGEESFTDFASIASHYNENEAGTITIPLRNPGNVSGLDVELGGTAVEGEDYSVVGITTEGVQIAITDDDDLEENETIRVRLLSGGGSAQGNAVHTVTIINNCEDTDGVDINHFAGDYDATEKYGPTEEDWYGPYTIHLEQDEEDPNTYHFDNLYDSGCDAYMVFDFEAGTVYFPDQSPCGVPLTNSSGTFEIDLCEGTELNINLNFDDADWQYTFKKHI